MTWYNEVSKKDFDNFNEIKELYGNASLANNQSVVFNIKGNEFRLVVSFNFRRKTSYSIWFGTHKEYDKIDVETIEFDENL